MGALRSGILKLVFLSSVAGVTGCSNLYPLTMVRPPIDTNATQRHPLSTEADVSDIYNGQQTQQQSAPVYAPQTQQPVIIYRDNTDPQYRRDHRDPEQVRLEREWQRNLERTRQDARAKDCEDKKVGVYSYRQDRCELPRHPRKR